MKNKKPTYKSFKDIKEYVKQFEKTISDPFLLKQFLKEIKYNKHIANFNLRNHIISDEENNLKMYPYLVEALTETFDEGAINKQDQKSFDKVYEVIFNKEKQADNLLHFCDVFMEILAKSPGMTILNSFAAQLLPAIPNHPSIDKIDKLTVLVSFLTFAGSDEDNDIYTYYLDNPNTNRFTIENELDIPSELSRELEGITKMPPMLYTPRKITHNRQTGRIFNDPTNSSVLLGKVKHHEKKLDLDVLNILNNTPLCINEYIYKEWVEDRKPVIPTHNEKGYPIVGAEARSLLKTVVTEIESVDSLVADILDNNNTYYAEHGFDKRGRMYDRTLNLNYQSEELYKATIDIKQELPVNSDVIRYIKYDIACHMGGTTVKWDTKFKKYLKKVLKDSTLFNKRDIADIKRYLSESKTFKGDKSEWIIRELFIDCILTNKGKLKNADINLLWDYFEDDEAISYSDEILLDKAIHALEEAEKTGLTSHTIGLDATMSVKV